MASLTVDPRRNWLLKHVPDEDRQNLARFLRPARVERHEVLCEPHEPLRAVYFPVSCVLSVFVVMKDGAGAEAATVGCEGVVGLEGLFATETVRASAQIKAQIGGDMIAGEVAPLRRFAAGNPFFRQMLERYFQAFLHQALQSVGCSKLHDLTQRLSRWLLMLHDRVGGDVVPITHEMLAEMLGVRRATVSVAVNRLQEAGAIRLGRSAVTILRRDRLIATSCECYGVVHETYRRALRSSPWPVPAI